MENDVMKHITGGLVNARGLSVYEGQCVCWPNAGYRTLKLVSLKSKEDRVNTGHCGLLSMMTWPLYEGTRPWRALQS